MRGRQVLVSSLLGVALVAQVAPASADPLAECIGANERSVALRRQGRLIEARQALAACTAPTCPDVIQEACAARMAEVNAAMPSLVFDVRDGAGRPLGGVQVVIDGTFAGAIGAVALAVNPGSHAIRFEASGQVPVEQTVVVLAGERNKRVEAVLGPQAPHKDPTGRLLVMTDAAAVVSVDGQPATGGRFDGHLPPGPHKVSVSAPGKQPYEAQVDVRASETRTLSVSLEDEKKKGGAAWWPWVAAGAAVAVGAAVGGYFLFKPSDQTTPVPPGKTAALQLASWKGP